MEGKKASSRTGSQWTAKQSATTTTSFTSQPWELSTADGIGTKEAVEDQTMPMEQVHPLLARVSLLSAEPPGNHQAANHQAPTKNLNRSLSPNPHRKKKWKSLLLPPLQPWMPRQLRIVLLLHHTKYVQHIFLAWRLRCRVSWLYLWTSVSIARRPNKAPQPQHHSHLNHEN